jgi:hypothetical protein
MLILAIAESCCYFSRLWGLDADHARNAPVFGERIENMF